MVEPELESTGIEPRQFEKKLSPVVGSTAPFRKLGLRLAQV
jgi:hypothetical protein